MAVETGMKHLVHRSVDGGLDLLGRDILARCLFEHRVQHVDALNARWPRLAAAVSTQIVARHDEGLAIDGDALQSLQQLIFFNRLDDDVVGAGLHGVFDGVEMIAGNEGRHQYERIGTNLVVADITDKFRTGWDRDRRRQ